MNIYIAKSSYTNAFCIFTTKPTMQMDRRTQSLWTNGKKLCELYLLDQFIPILKDLKPMSLWELSITTTNEMQTTITVVNKSVPFEIKMS